MREVSEEVPGDSAGEIVGGEFEGCDVTVVVTVGGKK